MYQKFLLTTFSMILCFSAHSVVLDNHEIQDILNYHREYPNSAIVHKFKGMLNSFNSSTDIACAEIASKVLRDSFLIENSDEYKVCMRKSLIFMLKDLNFNQEELDQFISRFADQKINWKLEELIRKTIETKEKQLQNSFGVHCPTGNIRFGAYTGSGADVESLLCQNIILESLVDNYSETSRIDDLSCGAMYSSCQGVHYTQEELLNMVTE